MSKHTIVIGGGVGGLSAAIRLAAAGVRVTILEKNPTLGGKLNLWEIPHPNRPSDRPFKFDTGPSLLTLPFVFEELFTAANEKLSDHLDLIRLNPIARFQWPDGSVFELKSTAAETELEVSRFAPDQLIGWKNFAARGKQIWDLSAEMFLYHAPEQVLRGAVVAATPASPLGSISDRGRRRRRSYMAIDAAHRALSMLTIPLRIGMFSRFNKLIDKNITNQKLRELLYQYATYSGASPFRAPATLAVIPHAEQYFGGWYPRGGMYRIAESLISLANKLGVEIRANCPVAQILIEDAEAKGVILSDGQMIKSDAVIANSDVVYTYRNLIPKQHRKKYNDRTLDKLEPGGSGMVLLLGIDGTYSQLAHHTKFMPTDYTSDLTAMFETRTIPTDPCIYVAASTRTDPTQAPDNCENLFILASAPAIDGQLDWSIQGPRYRNQLIETLERKWGLTNLSKRIVVEKHFTPKDLQSTFNANAGSIYGIGSNSRRTAFLRPPNRDREIKNLYFAGGATHPGGGLPLVALSGKIAAELALENC